MREDGADEEAGPPRTDEGVCNVDVSDDGSAVVVWGDGVVTAVLVEKFRPAAWAFGLPIWSPSARGTICWSVGGRNGRKNQPANEPRNE